MSRDAHPRVQPRVHAYPLQCIEQAKHNLIHDMIQPPPKCFGSELIGLFSRSIVNSSKQQQKKQGSCMRILSDYTPSAIQKWAQVTQEKSGLAPRTQTHFTTGVH
eukprot:1159113-Pelagomonas_calceolata.AAC.18